MHHIRFQLELRPRSSWGSLQRYLTFPSWIEGVLYCKGKEVEAYREGKEGRDVRMAKEGRVRRERDEKGEEGRGTFASLCLSV